jgi:hypothetical protein
VASLLKRWIQSIALALASVAVLLVLLEAGVRLFVPTSRWLFLDGAAGLEARPAARLGEPARSRRHLADAVRVGALPHQSGRPDPGDRGAREGAGHDAIMIFGDSMVVGRFFGQDEIYSGRLERALRERGLPVEVINAGVQGYSTDQALC